MRKPRVRPPKVKVTLHRVVIPGVYMCGVKERDTGARGTACNRFVTCADCLTALHAKQAAARERERKSGAA